MSIVVLQLFMHVISHKIVMTKDEMESVSAETVVETGAEEITGSDAVSTEVEVASETEVAPEVEAVADETVEDATEAVSSDEASVENLGSSEEVV